MDILLKDEGKIVKYYIDTLELSKNCTNSENAILTFIDSDVANDVVNEVIILYENSEKITENQDNKSIFLFSNGIFSNLCRSKKGFTYLFNKIGLIKFITIAKLTDNLDILSAVVGLLVNYFQNETKEHQDLIDDILIVIKKCLVFVGRTCDLLDDCYMLSGLIYNTDLIEKMIPLSKIINYIRSDQLDKQRIRHLF